MISSVLLLGSWQVLIPSCVVLRTDSLVVRLAAANEPGKAGYKTDGKEDSHGDQHAIPEGRLRVFLGATRKTFSGLFEKFFRLRRGVSLRGQRS